MVSGTFDAGAIARTAQALDDALGRLAAAQAREARLVGALEQYEEASGIDHGGMEEDCEVCVAMNKGKAALTADGAALAAAISALVDSHGSTEDLCRLVDALRAEWRGA